STNSGTMLNVRESMSTKTAIAPQYRMQLAVAMKEWLTVMTSSPGFTPAASNAKCNADVQLETAVAWGAPTYSANSRSNAATSGPWVTQPDRIGRRAARASASPIVGLATGIIFDTGVLAGRSVSQFRTTSSCSSSSADTPCEQYHSFNR